jgi:hypothetical protein
VASPKTVYAQVPTQYGRAPVDLVAPRRIVRPVRAGHPFVERVTADGSTSLPVQKGEMLGNLTLVQDGRVVARTPLVAREAEPGPGLLHRLRWYLGHGFHDVWSWL